MIEVKRSRIKNVINKSRNKGIVIACLKRGDVRSTLTLSEKEIILGCDDENPVRTFQ